MQLELIGPHPFARDEQGRQITRIGTLFPAYGALWTQVPGVHALQRLGFIERVNSERAAQGPAPAQPGGGGKAFRRVGGPDLRGRPHPDPARPRAHGPGLRRGRAAAKAGVQTAGQVPLGGGPAGAGGDQASRRVLAAQLDSPDAARPRSGWCSARRWASTACRFTSTTG